MRIAKLFFPLTFILLIMISCSNRADESSSNASLLIYNDKQYIGTRVESSANFPNKKMVASVKQKTKPEGPVTSNLSSNEFDAGTKIYELDNSELGIEYESSKEMKIFKLKE